MLEPEFLKFFYFFILYEYVFSVFSGLCLEISFLLNFHTMAAFFMNQILNYISLNFLALTFLSQLEMIKVISGKTYECNILTGSIKYIVARLKIWSLF